MHPEMARMLAEQRRRELIGLAGRRAMARGAEHTRAVPGWRVPGYRVSWSRVTLSPSGGAGRRGRSWIIVISATRGL